MNFNSMPADPTLTFHCEDDDFHSTADPVLDCCSPTIRPLSSLREFPANLTHSFVVLAVDEVDGFRKEGVDEVWGISVKVTFWQQQVITSL